MARQPSFATPKVEEWRSIDLADLRRWQLLDPGAAKIDRIPAVTWGTPEGIDKLGVVAKSNGVLFLKRDGQSQLGNLFVPFLFAAARFGGRRAWFRCPGCGQGCRVLYGVAALRCRKCRGLKYQSQYESPAFRLIGRARKIRRRLGKAGRSGDPLPPKPRHMRWRTNHRLTRLVSALEENAGLMAISTYVDQLHRKVRIGVGK
jgi:hypothetical protein